MAKKNIAYNTSIPKIDFISISEGCVVVIDGQKILVSVGIGTVYRYFGPDTKYRYRYRRISNIDTSIGIGTAEAQTPIPASVLVSLRLKLRYKYPYRHRWKNTVSPISATSVFRVYH